MKSLVKLMAPAKVNLVLAVGDVREDGFHEVNTVMHALSLHDTLTMRRFDEEGSGRGLEVNFSCENSGDIDALGIPVEENIAYRAVFDLARELGREVDESIEMHLAKTIPAEAGLGGGSSDAAAALLGAATLWDVAPDDPRVLAVAARLGADVPFFLHGGSVRLSGKGDVLEGQLEPRRGFVLLLRPAVGVSTAAAYAAFDRDPEPPMPEFLAKLAGAARAEDVGLWNNMTDAACAVVPEVAEVMAWAREAKKATGMVLCGSGSAVCVTFDSYDDACACSIEAHKQGWWSRVTSFSPLGASVIQAV